VSDLDDIVKEFLVESYENLDRLDRELVALEKNPSSRETLASIFRTIHTIKGTCGFLGFGKLESVAHVGENLLSRLRDGHLSLDAERTSALLAMVDAVRTMLSSIESSGTDGEQEYKPLIETLSRLQEKKAAPEAPAATAATPPAASAPAPAPAPVAAAAPPPAPAAQAPPPDPVPPPAAETHHEAAEPATAAAAASTGVTDTTIRVDVGLLDKLMNLVGELVLARNQILQFTGTQKDPTFLGTTQRLNLITSELQEGVMKTRMQPIGNVWSKFPRVVRDLAISCSKKVRVEMEGKETDLDKTIIEAIKDPLTHLVRNSVDHGIETPDVRTRNKKPAEGRLLLRAYHEGGQVIIEIVDDGGGIDPEKVKRKAVEKGLITQAQAQRMGDRDAVNLIFLPGFSTAEKVSNISGRGVGMDVVKTNIEKIGGSVDIQSKPGEGTTIKIKIPLTLAIIPALIVTCAGDKYAIPQVSLLELVRLEGEHARKGIEFIHGTPVYRLRGRLLPLVSLSRELGVSDGTFPTKNAQGEFEAVNIVVLQADDRTFGLVVDGINDTEEIVVKPLGKQLKAITVYAGATIRGDGRVALILDVMGIAQRSGVISESRDRAHLELETESANSQITIHTLLLCSAGEKRRFAIPLTQVARLEEIRTSDVETAGGIQAVQYRGQIMPLMRLSNFLGCESAPDGDLLQVVVYSRGDRSVGLVVESILDIVEETLAVRGKAFQRGMIGTAVVQGKATDLIDIEAVISSFDPTFLTESAAAAVGA